MRIAILINHNTAGKFFGNILKELGHETYIPLKCSCEKYALVDEDVKNIRTLNKEEYIDKLDNYDFYSSNNNQERNELIYEILVNNFDIIFTLHVININLNIMLSNTNKIIYYVLWGDFKINNRNNYSFIENNINNIENKYYLIMHKFLLEPYSKFLNLNKIKYARIGLPFQENYKNIYKLRENNNKILIVLSRLHILNYLGDWINNYFSKIFPNLIIYVIGKFNENYHFTSNNVIKMCFDDINDVYKNMNECCINLNISLDENILQYSVIECANMNIPTLYRNNSSVSKIIDNKNINNIFSYGDDNDLIKKIIILIIENRLKDYEDIYTENNKKLYEEYDINKVKDDWIKIL